MSDSQIRRCFTCKSRQSNIPTHSRLTRRSLKTETGGGMKGDESNDGGRAMNIEAEGPTLLSTTVVNRTFVFQQLRQTVEQLRGVGAIR